MSTRTLMLAFLAVVIAGPVSICDLVLALASPGWVAGEGG